MYGTSNGQVQNCTVVRKSQMYSALSEELARMYNAAGRREESLACHLAVRNQLLKNGYREGSMLLMVDNNMSVVYLDLGRPEEAIPYLTEALELTKENGLVGSAVAEPTWNLARVYRALGDEEKGRYISESRRGKGLPGNATPARETFPESGLPQNRE